MKDKWMNLGCEEDELKPYVEPEQDFKEPKRIGMFYSNCNAQSEFYNYNITIIYFESLKSVIKHFINYIVPVCRVTEILVGMGYSRGEIEESLSQAKYDDIFATYLLLGRKSNDVRNQEKKLFIINIQSFLFSVLYSPKVMVLDLVVHYH